MRIAMKLTGRRMGKLSRLITVLGTVLCVGLVWIGSLSNQYTPWQLARTTSVQKPQPPQPPHPSRAPPFPRSSRSQDFVTIIDTIPRPPAQSLQSHLEAILGPQDFAMYLGDDCAPTSQVRLYHSNNNTNNTTTMRWMMRALDGQGNEKWQGGDEFYIAYFEEEPGRMGLPKGSGQKQKTDPTAVAWVEDFHDGTYALDFVTTPMQRYLDPRRTRRGRLQIFFQYTCQLGQLSPKAKHQWKSGGRSDLEFWTTVRVPEPPIRVFQPPTTYNLSRYSTVFFVGDSLFQQLVRNDDDKRRRYYFRPNTFIAKPIIQTDLSMETVQSKFIHHIESRHGNELRGLIPEAPAQSWTENSNKNNIAVVIGSFVWDILASTKEESFSSHLQACEHYVETVRTKFPNVTFFWKSGTAMHVHRLPSNCSDDPFCNMRTRYMSSSRASFLYQQQKKLMDQLNVPFLDLFEATYLSGYQSRPGDGRHYTSLLNNQMSKFLFGLDV